jgi:hypothetical protein
MDQLVRQLKAEKFAELYCNSLPPRVMISRDGTVDLMRHTMYFWTKEDGGRDIILYTGDAQPVNPEAAYGLADKALEIGKSLGVGTVITVGAYITGEFVSEPRVFGTGTDKELLREFKAAGVSLINEGSVTWMNGLLVGLSKLRDLKAVFLSGETSGYVADARAARAVLMSLSEKMNLKIDLGELEKKAEENEPLVKSMVEMQARARAEKSETGYIG